MPRRLIGPDRVTVVLVAVAGLLGVSGVMLGAAGAHRGGGDLTALASTFSILHAGTILALASLRVTLPRLSAGLTVAASAIGLGTLMFAGDLSMAGLASWHPLPLAAPIGGMLLILGWIAVPVTAVTSLLGSLAGRADRLDGSKG